jgi:hypothetical protein
MPPFKLYGFLWTDFWEKLGYLQSTYHQTKQDLLLLNFPYICFSRYTLQNYMKLLRRSVDNSYFKPVQLFIEYCDIRPCRYSDRIMCSKISVSFAQDRTHDLATTRRVQRQHNSSYMRNATSRIRTRRNFDHHGNTRTQFPLSVVSSQDQTHTTNRSNK